VTDANDGGRGTRATIGGVAIGAAGAVDADAGGSDDAGSGKPQLGQVCALTDATTRPHVGKCIQIIPFQVADGPNEPQNKSYAASILPQDKKRAVSREIAVMELDGDEGAPLYSLG